MGFFSNPGRMRHVIRRRVTLHTRDGRSLEGVLVGVYRDAYALAHAEYLLEDGRREQLPGEVLVPADNLSFVQAPFEASS